MSIPTSVIPAKRRVHRKRRGGASAGPTPPPPLANQIVSVVFGPGADQLTVTVNNPVVSVQDPALGMWVFFNDLDPAQAIAADKTDDTHVVFTFAVDVTTGYAWHVEDPAVWEMAGGGPLVEPYDGPLS